MCVCVCVCVCVYLAYTCTIVCQATGQFFIIQILSGARP